jgi:hypothetical protein
MNAAAPDVSDPVDILARTLWGEARGEGEAGMLAVAAVVLNRIRVSGEHGGRHWWGRDAISVCRAKAQFLCWSPANPNRAGLLAVDEGDPDFSLARAVAVRALGGLIDDPTYGATSYRQASLPWPLSWGRLRLPLVTIGKHSFYNLNID